MTSQEPAGPTSSHRLELESVELVGGGRKVPFHPGLNIIQGDITSGKTTLVRLISALLGPMPSNLPPEVEQLTAIRGEVVLGNTVWSIYRPRTTTSTAPVEISEIVHGREPSSTRLPVTGNGPSYGKFLLEQLGLPSVSVPRARSDPSGALTPVSIRDWLNYCIITGDELDTQVFGHLRPWREEKRRWVFELVYGYYDPELAILRAELRTLELQIQEHQKSEAISQRFLAQTPFASAEALDRELAGRRQQLAELVNRRRNLAGGMDRSRPELARIRAELLAARTRFAALSEQLSGLAAQASDLADLEQQLRAQSARLTRAIVADELLVDFDFVVCPRCGQGVSPGRAEDGHCYLCFQEPRPAPSTSALLAEQERIASQIEETTDVLRERLAARGQLEAERSALDAEIIELSRRLDEGTSIFISDRSSQLQQEAAEQATLEADIRRLTEYSELVHRYQASLSDREALRREADAVEERIRAYGIKRVDAEGNVRALEQRCLEYLRELRIPDFSPAELQVHINRSTYLPEVSGRAFETLSSQGLKTLVNIAHALAHHTVAIDRGLPLPGLLILDGISSNAGQKGFDLARIRDVYDLLARTAQWYLGRLQIVAVDNEVNNAVSLEHRESLILGLRQSDRLIRGL
ncbi:hypothetical protein EV650_0943 [Kribbella kalugense]|uniref:AAA domain-containing protein n=1 Tax=Kribbella kalugense TaxID=2512221 RepID=A0A4R8A1T7_9ACTN|nr:hypothetical protein EV650_0943 [Kribbella kalugense]